MSEKNHPLYHENDHAEKQNGIYCSLVNLVTFIAVCVILIVTVGLITGLISHRIIVKSTPISSTVRHTTPTMIPTTLTGPKYSQLSNPRLPNTVRPLNYTFQLDFDMNQFKINGINVIEINVTSTTNIILVHADGLTMLAAPQVANHANFNTNSTNFAVADHGTYAKNSYYYVVLRENLAIGVYYIKFNYVAAISSGLFGLYKYQYTRAFDHEVIWGIASQLEASYARQVLPCFDEPALKARFTATIIIPNNYTTRWNMPLLKKEAMANNKNRYQFGTTLVMSTYLLAFTVDDFDFVEGRTARNTRIRVYARESVKNDTYFALGVATNMTEFFENLLAIPYPLPKQDHVAIPAFSFTGMENWGLCLYREQFIIYNYYLTTLTFKRAIATTITNEIAHMWFGNLVTMTFWNHLWTKEGMATFLSSYAANTYLPSMKLMEFFTVDELRNGLVVDSSASHPLVPPAQYGPFFDVITYSKGGSIFRMIHNYVGNDDFVASLKHYLTKFSYKTAITEQLFAVMTTTINKFNVSNYFDCWVYQMGYPLVTVTRDSSNTNGGIVNQARYLSNTNANPSVDNPTSPYKSRCGYKWNIPITYVTSNNPTTTMKANFYKNTSNLQISWPNNTWIKANIDQIGFYRVNYDLSNWDALATALQIDHSVLSNLDIASLLDDAFQFAANDMVDYMAPLNLTKYLSKEIDFLPWHTANKHLDTIGGRLAGSSYYQDYIQYHLQILKPAVDTLGVIDIGTDIEKEARSEVLKSACTLGNTACIVNTSRMFYAYMQDPIRNKIPGSLREVAFRTGIEYGSVQEWDFVYNIYRTTLIPTERSSAFYAMSFPRDPYIINRYLQFATDPTKIDPSNTMTVFVFLTFNPVGRDLVWEYVRQNTGYFMNRFKSTRPIVNIASRRLNSQFRLNQVKQFFKDHPESGPNAAASEAQTIAAINANIKYLNKYGKTFSTWFKQNIKMD